MYIDQIQEFANGQTDYVLRLNSNFSGVASGLDTLTALIQGNAGASATLGTSLRAIFGALPSLIGSGSYNGSVAGSVVTLGSGLAWLPNGVGGTVTNGSSSTYDFNGSGSGTYQVSVSANGQATGGASLTDPLYQVTYNGSGSLSNLQFIGSVYGVERLRTITLPYTMNRGDVNSTLIYAGTGTGTLTLPGAFVGSGKVTVLQVGTGNLSIVAGAGATLQAPGSGIGLSQYRKVDLLCTDSALVSGTGSSTFAVAYDPVLVPVEQSAVETGAMYPVWVSGSGLATDLSITSGGLSFIPASGQLSVTRLVASYSGTGTTVFPVEASAESTNTGTVFAFFQTSAYGGASGAGQAFFAMRRANGSSGSPSGLASGSTLGGLLFQCYDSSGSGSFKEVARVSCATTQTTSAGPTLSGQVTISLDQDASFGVRVLTGNQVLLGNVTASGTDSVQASGVVRATSGFRPGNAAVADASLLDYYLEDVFTPVVIGETVAGTATYTVQSGRFTRVGNRVKCTIHCVFSGHTGSGNLRVTGLPFASSGATQGSYGVAFIHSGPTWTAGHLPCAYVAPGTSVLRALTGVSGGVFGAVTLTAAGDVTFDFEYEV